MPPQPIPKGFVRKSTFIRPEIRERLKAYADARTMREYGILDLALRRFFEQEDRKERDRERRRLKNSV